ncbi:aminoglycoside phosphotransferase (APT) family kinase protein [Roseibium hamelinense]|uniref:Aminoglycoside phosphotransferase (APT) family kinase protein n=1 Tax=Roseibium hamelinense TaxID=150831 RepID=A0A562TG51_9HYPH|nr:phosphotransferase family protein [Roseibium hamelinense]MTI43114.1 phosphotransferase family protein [Roseibium hamelinense]TWI92539.1 aminoglycoside phosphotransferase (APT) family kinase protein [Roseibium hamelinense]
MADVEFAGLDFERHALQEVLRNELGPAGRFSVQRISGGQSNPTYFVDWGAERLVLRKQPNGPILRGAHAIDREYRVLKALSGTSVPVAEPLLFHEDPGALGTPFYLMQRVEGRVLDDAALGSVPREHRRAIWMAVADAMAKMHAVLPADVGLSDYGKPGNYFARQINRWSRQYEASGTGRIPELDHLCQWLPDNTPEDDGLVRLAHGDFRIGNMLFHPEKPEVVAILDWELSTLGHPMADLGFCCMPWHTAPDEYGGIFGLDVSGSGLPQERDFIARYQSQVTFPAQLLPFHKAFALFRFAVIFVGISDRAKAGSAADPRAAELGPLAQRFAIRALEIIDGKHGS